MPNIESGDLSIPSIRFNEKQIEQFLSEGKTMQWIKEEEARRNLDIAEDQMRSEQKAA